MLALRVCELEWRYDFASNSFLLSAAGFSSSSKKVHHLSRGSAAPIMTTPAVFLVVGIRESLRILLQYHAIALWGTSSLT